MPLHNMPSGCIKLTEIKEGLPTLATCATFKTKVRLRVHSYETREHKRCGVLSMKNFGERMDQLFPLISMSSLMHLAKPFQPKKRKTAPNSNGNGPCQDQAYASLIEKAKGPLRRCPRVQSARIRTHV